MTITSTDREMIAIAKKALKSGYGLGCRPKADRGLAQSEKALTLITLTNGKVVKCWGNQKVLQVFGAARRERSEITKVEYVVADFHTKATIRVVSTFTVARVGNKFELVSA